MYVFSLCVCVCLCMCMGVRVCLCLECIYWNFDCSTHHASLRLVVDTCHRVTFGSPRVGNPAFALYAQSVISSIERVTHSHGMHQ